MDATKSERIKAGLQKSFRSGISSEASTVCYGYRAAAKVFNIHTANICNLLRDKPESYIIAAEGVLCALVKGFSAYQEEGLN